jgi:hypothetical protein
VPNLASGLILNREGAAAALEPLSLAASGTDEVDSTTKMDATLANSVYYAFSTFSQTLAGAIGFLAAVVLYRIQGLDAEINVYGESVVTYWPNVSPGDLNVDAVKAHRFWRTRQFAELIALVKQTPNATEDNPQRKEDYGRLVPVLGIRKQLLGVLRGARSDHACACHVWARPDPRPRDSSAVLGVGYSAFVACLVAYGVVAVTIFRSHSPAS